MMDRPLLGTLHFALGVCGLLAAAIMIFLMAVGGIFCGEELAFQFGCRVGAFICLAMMMFSLPALAAGIGLLRGRAWADRLALIAGLLSLPALPVGTALGVYTLWSYWQERSLMG